MQDLTSKARIGALGADYKEIISTLIADMRQDIYKDIESASEAELLTLKARLINLSVLEGRLNSVIQQGKSAQNKVINIGGDK